MSFLKSKLASLIIVIIDFLFFVPYFILGYKYGEPLFGTIALGLFLILLPLTIVFYFGKLKHIKLHKFMSFVDYFGILGLVMTDFILMTSYGMNIVIVQLLTFFVMVLSFFSGLFCLLQFLYICKKGSDFSESNNRSANFDCAANKLKSLKHLYDQGIISKEEYDEKKKKYIDQL